MLWFIELFNECVHTFFLNQQHNFVDFSNLSAGFMQSVTEGLILCQSVFATWWQWSFSTIFLLKYLKGHLEEDGGWQDKKKDIHVSRAGRPVLWCCCGDWITGTLPHNRLSQVRSVTPLCDNAVSPEIIWWIQDVCHILWGNMCTGCPFGLTSSVTTTPACQRFNADLHQQVGDRNKSGGVGGQK